MRLVPRWRTRRFGHLAASALAVMLLWCAVAAAMYVVVERADPIPGRIVSVRDGLSRRGSRLQHFEYVYGDGARGELNLVPHFARELGLKAGAPVTVKLAFGAPYVVGTPRVWVVAPIAAAGAFAIIVIVGLVFDRIEARRIALLLGGTLARGRLDRIVRTRFRGSEVLRLHYSFEGGSGSDRIRPAPGQPWPLALGLDRLPAEGDPVTVAHDGARSAIYSFGEDDAYPAPTKRPAPLPLERPRRLLGPTPRRAAPLTAWVLVVIGAAVIGIHALVPAEPLIYVGAMLASVGLMLVGTFWLPAVLRARRLLRHGTPVAAPILHVTDLGKYTSVAFEATLPDGRFRGKEYLRGVDAEVGDTLFLLVHPERAWERAAWGIAR
jgi:hypothetical protein